LWILGKKGGKMTYAERLTQLNLIPLVNDREKKGIILYFKCKNNFVDLDISQYVETTASRTRAGTSYLLQGPHLLVKMKFKDFSRTSKDFFQYIQGPGNWKNL
jgi:hypothetical protein